MSGTSRIEKDIVILNKQGLHARPAAMFVQIAQKYESDVTIERDGQEKVNGKSIMGILMLGVQKNEKVRIIVDGKDAEALMAELEAFLQRYE